MDMFNLSTEQINAFNQNDEFKKVGAIVNKRVWYFITLYDSYVIETFFCLILLFILFARLADIEGSAASGQKKKNRKNKRG